MFNIVSSSGLIHFPRLKLSTPGRIQYPFGVLMRLKVDEYNIVISVRTHIELSWSEHGDETTVGTVDRRRAA